MESRVGPDMTEVRVLCMPLKINENWEFGHVRTYSWLHQLRNTQIHGKYLGNMYGIYIYIYGIYKEYIRNIHEYLWYKIIRNTGPAFGGTPRGWPPSAAAPLGLCFQNMFLITLYHRYLWIFFIYSLYLLYIFFPKYVPKYFPLCVS